MIKVPDYITHSFESFLVQADVERGEGSGFLHSISEKKENRTHRMVECALGTMAKELARQIGNDSINRTDKSFCRSGSVQLANAGTLVSGLQTRKNWKSVTTPMECAEHVNRAYKDCMSMLDGEDFSAPLKKQNLSNLVN